MSPVSSPRSLSAILFAVLLPLSLTAYLPAQSTTELEKAAEAAWEDQDWSKAADALAKLVKVDAENQAAWFRLGYALHAQNKLDEALKCHKKAATVGNDPRLKSTAIYNAACVYSLKKDKDQAFEWLGKAVEAGFTNGTQIRGDTDMDNLRDDPRFAKLMDRLGKVSAEAPVQVYNYASERQSARVLFIGAGGAPGIALDYGAAPWKEEYADKLENKKFVNRRWRFGTNFWTNLDTNIPLSIGGQKLAAGYYYVTLEHKGDKKLVLNFLDPVEVRKQQIDPYVAHMTKGGTDVPLQHEMVDDVAEELNIKFTLDEGNTTGHLVIRFGPHKLTAPLKIHR